jgi:cytoskeleton protein RodZ
MPESDGAIGGKGNGLGLGERLRSARKARALSLEQVAESLHLDESVILALENERFEEFGAPVFVRGHLKTYARLVGLPLDGVIEAYKKADPDNEETLIVARGMTDHSVSINPVTWGFWGLVVLVGFALAVYVLQDDPVPPVFDGPTPAVVTETEPQDPAGDITDSPENAADTEAGFPVEAESPVETDAPEPTAEAMLSDFDLAAAEAEGEVNAQVIAETQVGEPAGPTVRLNLYFRQESWVEISDVNRRLLFGLQTEGRRRELVGEPPIQFILGNGQGVDLKVDDEPYVFSAVREGRVTRFEIGPATFDEKAR